MTKVEGVKGVSEVVYTTHHTPHTTRVYTLSHVFASFIFSSSIFLSTYKLCLQTAAKRETDGEEENNH